MVVHRTEELFGRFELSRQQRFSKFYFVRSDYVPDVEHDHIIQPLFELKAKPIPKRTTTLN